ncbi:MAG: penicillin-binding protein activator [Pseudomonadota bacterium]
MRGRLSKFRALFGAFALSLALGACSQSSGPGPWPGTVPNDSQTASSSGSETSGQSRALAIDPSQPVTLALLVPRTAQSDGAAALGGALANAAQLGVSELRDPQLRLRVYDTAGQPATAAVAARKALADGADIVLGPLFSGSTKAVADVVLPEGVPVISFSTDTAVAGIGVYVSGYAPEAEARRILDYAGAQGRRFVGIFRPLTPYGEAADRGVRAASASGRIEVVAAGAYERSFKGIETASAPFASDASSAGANAVLLPSGGKELQAVSSFLNYHRLDPARTKYLGLGQWNSRASFQEASLLGGWFPAPDPDAVRRFSSLYSARFGGQPPVLASLGYNAVRIAGELLAEARQTGRADLFDHAAVTRPAGFRGAFGPVRFRDDGVAEHGLAILEVGQRTFVVLDPAPRGYGAGS